MRRSLLIALAGLLAASVAIAALLTSTRAAESPAAPPSAHPDLKSDQTVPVIATLRMPEDFTLEGLPPVWFQGGEVAVTGRQSGRLIVFGYSGIRFERSRTLAADHAPEDQYGTIRDLAVSPDATMLATVVGAPGNDHIEIFVRDVSGDNEPRRVVRMDGQFGAAGLGWLDASTMALGIMPPPPTPEPTPAPTSSTTPTVGSGSPTPVSTPSQIEAGLYVVSLNRDSPAGKIKINCPRAIEFSHMTWAPGGHHAIADSDAPLPLLIDRSSSQCKSLNIPAAQRIHLLGWSASGDRFLYAAGPAGHYSGALFGFFEYELGSNNVRLIAAPAAAATYIHDGRIAALGNRKLNAGIIANRPDAMLAAEIALIDPRQSQIQITALGFNTPAAMLLNGSFSYSPIADELAIQLFLSDPGGAIPVILSFFPATLKVGVIATGRPGALLSMSWSPNGDLLAVLDASASPPLLTILSPPHPAN